MKKIVIVWPGLTGYLGSCFRALAELCDLRVYVEPSKYEQQFDARELDGLWWKRIEPCGRDAEEAVIREIRDWQADLVMVCGWGTPLCRAVGRAALGRRNVLDFDMPWEWSIRKIAARWILAPYLRHFDAAFVPSRRCACYARWLGFGGDRLKLGSNPSGWERFGSEALPAEWPKSFLFVGRFVKEKGLDVLLKAYEAYRAKSAAPWPLDLVGSGEALSSVLPEGVRCIGFVPSDEMPRILREHGCLVLPSRWEPWGVCVAEAMSAERATIVSASCGIADDVEPTCKVPAANVTALADALARISSMTEEARAAEGLRARAAMEPFSAANWARRVMELVDERRCGGKILHLMAGLGAASGVANIARRFARVQTERGEKAVLLAPAVKWNPIYFGPLFAIRALLQVPTADEIWVHCSWTFPVWYGAFLATVFGKKLVVVPEGSFDPKRLHNHAGWKKWLVVPLDRWVLRRADEVLALCRDEVDWVHAFESAAKVRHEQVPLFLREVGRVEVERGRREGPLHVLFLGRKEDPLKGVRFLERAVQEINEKGKVKSEKVRMIELRMESRVFGEEKEKAWEWCDVLCLPTLSENFGLVVAEALEHGKRVITTDGAPAWEIDNLHSTTTTPNYNSLVYLRGYRAGTDAERVKLLKDALLHAIMCDA